MGNGALITTSTGAIQVNTLSSYWLPNKITGFLPAEAPVKPEDLILSGYDSLRRIGLIAPELGSISDTKLGEFVSTLPVEPDIDPFHTTPAMCEAIIRAYVNIAAHLIHRPYFSPHRELPPAIARPLWIFSLYADRPPSLTYASYVLGNFTSPVRTRMLPQEFKIAQTPSGTPDEEWFIAAHLSVESIGGEVVEAIQNIERSLDINDIDTIVMFLESIESSVSFAAEIMPTIMDRMDADVFLYKIRPLLYGHDQITFRGVDNDRVVTYIGETGAQSGVIRAVDAILDIQHSAEINTSMNRFLMCAPPVHQQFFNYAAKVGKRLSTMKGNARISTAHQAAASALTEFRKSHLRAVASYLMPNGKKLAEYGTGGTRLTEWLKKMIDETKSSRGH